ncbi:MAG: dephospho-CoA kinase [Gammaproteobacteria bacterium]|nr:dephospho-CoA kinase [Gammaproteobacteria bacterium]
MNESCLKIGLTGGIGSGKTTVSDHFAALGVPILDADQIARDLVLPGQPALDKITEIFGKTMLREDGTLDRARLKGLVFADSAARKRLEAILHPRIRRIMEEQVASLAAVYCLLSIPLLIETQQTELVHRILAVDCTQAVQRKRIAGRDGASAEEIERILAAQCNQQTRLAYADDVIHNDIDETEAGRGAGRLAQQVLNLHRFYLNWAGNRRDMV